MVSNILTVGPKTMTPASKTTAKIKFVLDRILTPFPKPDKAEIRKECRNDDNDDLHKTIIRNTKDIGETTIDL